MKLSLIHYRILGAFLFLSALLILAYGKGPLLGIIAGILIGFGVMLLINGGFSKKRY